MFIAELVRDNMEDTNEVFWIGGLEHGIDYTNGKKLKEQRGNYKVIQILIMAWT